ncbi:aconitate hydratase, partial [Clostridium beijerinckii]|nr:aconitate hydratase [Clostridium beijerinckii]
MKQNITRKILQSHLVEGQMIAGEEILIKIDQTLTQDATGTMSYLAFEALGIPKVRTEVSVSYIDHNTLQAGFENADDHLFLQSIAKKHGIYCSRPGNGICHQLHTERFAAPGKTLLGSDSHTPTSGALGMIAIGAGGMSVAMAMAGQPFPLVMPQVINVKLAGKLKPGVAAKDVILEILRIMTVKGGVGKVLEYTGSGVETLSVTERQTITNMGAELGVTTSLFPSDKVAYEFMKAQGREKDWVELLPDEDAEYDGVMEINLDEIEPMVAQPSMPDKVVKIKDLEKTKLHQVFIGSCTNASYSDLAKAAAILDGKCVHPDVSLSVAAGSKQVFEMIARDGILQKLIASGARVLESACGPCVGIGQAPPSAGVSLRTSNRNFRGRSGTKDAQVYLSSPEVAAASAIAGVIIDPKDVVDVSILE